MRFWLITFDWLHIPRSYLMDGWDFSYNRVHYGSVQNFQEGRSNRLFSNRQPQKSKIGWLVGLVKMVPCCPALRVTTISEPRANFHMGPSPMHTHAPLPT